MTDENEDLIEFASPPPNSSRRESRKQQSLTLSNTTINTSSNNNKTTESASGSLSAVKSTPPPSLLDITLSNSQDGDVGEGGLENTSTSSSTTTAKRLAFNENKQTSSDKPSILIHVDGPSESSSLGLNNATLVNISNGGRIMDAGGEQTADLDIVDVDSELINVDQDFW